MDSILRTRVLDALFDGEDASFVAQVTGAPEKEVYEWAANRQEYALVKNNGMEWLVQTKETDSLG